MTRMIPKKQVIFIRSIALKVLSARALEITESIENTHSLIINLNNSDIQLMDFLRVTEVIRNVD